MYIDQGVILQPFGSCYSLSAGRPEANFPLALVLLYKGQNGQSHILRGILYNKIGQAHCKRFEKGEMWKNKKRSQNSLI
jgi:hypothetical protein